MSRRVVALAIAVATLAGACSQGADDAAPASTTSTTGPPFFSGDEPSAPDPIPPVSVQVLLLDTTVDPPVPVGVERKVPGVDTARYTALALLAGPTADEAERGLRLPDTGITGVTEVGVVDGVARVRLLGTCRPSDDPVHLGTLMVASLRSVPGVLNVKVLGPRGSTTDPKGPGDSTPRCLEPRPES